MSIIKIALTGGIASGKTQMSRLFAEKGVLVIDMDVAAREVTRPKTVAYQALIAEFGSQILQVDGTLNRALLRKMMFNNAQIKQTIEHIVQPKILQWVEEKLSTMNAGMVLIVVPPLNEKKLADLYDSIIVIDCNEQVQIKRLMARDRISKKQAKSILAQQVSRANRQAFVKQHTNVYLVDNSNGKQHLAKQADALFQLFNIE